MSRGRGACAHVRGTPGRLRESPGNALAARAAQAGPEFTWREFRAVNTMDVHRLGRLAREAGRG